MVVSAPPVRCTPWETSQTALLFPPPLGSSTRRDGEGACADFSSQGRVGEAQRWARTSCVFHRRCQQNHKDSPCQTGINPTCQLLWEKLSATRIRSQEQRWEGSISVTVTRTYHQTSFTTKSLCINSHHSPHKVRRVFVSNATRAGTRQTRLFSLAARSERERESDPWRGKLRPLHATVVPQHIHAPRNERLPRHHPLPPHFARAGRHSHHKCASKHIHRQ